MRVRFGSGVRCLEPGIHFVVPVIDRVFRQNIRTRIVAIQPQNITTKDGVALTVAGAIQYRIADIEKTYNAVCDLSGTLHESVAATVAREVSRRTLALCLPKDIEDAVVDSVDFSRWGIEVEGFSVTDFVKVKTYRLITGEIHKYSWSGSVNLDQAVGENKSDRAA